MITFKDRIVTPVPCETLDAFSKAMEERVIKPVQARAIQQQYLVDKARKRPIRGRS